jgi:hypothetical protein
MAVTGLAVTAGMVVWTVGDRGLALVFWAGALANVSWTVAAIVKRRFRRDVESTE